MTLHGLWVSDCNEITKGQLHMIQSLPESKNKHTNAIVPKQYSVHAKCGGQLEKRYAIV